MRIKAGYVKFIYENSGALVAAAIRSEGSVLLSGSTGTGKTTLLFFLLYNYIREFGTDALDLEVCDYKYDMPFLYGSGRYHYDVMDIVGTIDRHYQAMQSSRGSSGNKVLHCLVIDEYLSFMSYLEAMSKSDKTLKEAYQRVTMEITGLLAMGRSLGYTLICVVQQANAKSFSSTADRENFINKIAMGTQTNTAAAMIFDSADTNSIDYRKPMPIGCGFLSVQGEPVKEIIVPRITNPDVMQQRIREFLDKLDVNKPL